MNQATQPMETHEEEGIQVVGFHVGEEEYGVEILNVVGVERLENVLRFPRMPAFIEGVIRIRDEIVPLVKLRTRFGLDEQSTDERTRVMVLDIKDQTVGLIVDSVTTVRRLLKSDIEEAPAMALTLESRFVKGVLRMGEQMIILLNPDELLFEAEAEQLGRTKAVAKHYVPVEA